MPECPLSKNDLARDVLDGIALCSNCADLPSNAAPQRTLGRCLRSRTARNAVKWSSARATSISHVMVQKIIRIYVCFYVHGLAVQQ